MVLRLALMFLGTIVTACGAVAAPTPTPDALAGQFASTGGGTGVAPMKALAARFNQLHPRVSWTVDETNSDAAIKLTASGDVDLGFISRVLTADEKTRVAAVSMGVSGTAVVVNAANPITNLTNDQLRGIYSGELTSWSQLGGPDVTIRPFMREQGAATRGAFESFVFAGKPKYGTAVSVLVETDAMLSAVESFSGAIGIASVAPRTASDQKIRMISVDGIAPNGEGLATGSYKMSRPVFLVYPADASRVKPAVRAFLDFVRSPEGQRIAAEAL